MYGVDRFWRCSYAIRTGLILVWIINSLIRHLPDILGGVFLMIELSLRVIVRLNDLTDQEFAEMEFVAAE